MSATAHRTDKPHVLVGYDGSPDAANALEIGARLLPGFAAHVVHVWAPPFASGELRRRLLRTAASLDEGEQPSVLSAILKYHATERMRTALNETVIEGIQTNIPLHRELMVDAKFMNGGTNIHYLEEWLGTHKR